MPREKKIKDLGFSAFSLLDASKSLRIFFSVFDLLLGIFGSLALAVATLGIVNTLVMAILNAAAEIGVRESAWRRRWRCEANCFFRRSWRDGTYRRRAWRFASAG